MNALRTSSPVGCAAPPQARQPLRSTSAARHPGACGCGLPRRHGTARRVVLRRSQDDPKGDQLTKSIDAAGAGGSIVSPQVQLAIANLFKLLFGRLGIPLANPTPEDMNSLLGGALFLPLYKWFRETGPVFLLPTGPVSSFLVVSDRETIKHVLRGSDNPANDLYSKGLITEVSQYLFGVGFAVAQGEEWRVRRKAVGPALHRKYLEAMVGLTFAPAATLLADKLVSEIRAGGGKPIDIEQGFNQMTLDVIGKAVFNYEFDALTTESPIIQAVYTALKETESRTTDLIPYWKSPLLCKIAPRQRKAAAAVEEIRVVTEGLIRKCKEMVDEEEMAQASNEEEYLNQGDPSILRFLIAAREETTSTQLRDDLLSMLVAGHETTASALTWTSYLLAKNPKALAKATEEVDRVLGDRAEPTFDDYRELKYTLRCVCESMRLYPHPPVLIRRAVKDDPLPYGGGKYVARKGQDVILSIYNLHRSPEVWDDPDAFIPERFDPEGPIPNEQNTDFRYVPFSGGPRKCVGDQFALMEATVALAVLLKRIHLEPVEGFDPGMTTGATIHTRNGMFLRLSERAGRERAGGEQAATTAPVGA
ncbi:unnamed protein product [Pedinophyceae sp. YPF-701]|nr:unnamed protein product [Pedinophyceae sp. YPF-701]